MGQNQYGCRRESKYGYGVKTYGPKITIFCMVQEVHTPICYFTTLHYSTQVQSVTHSHRVDSASMDILLTNIKKLNKHDTRWAAKSHPPRWRVLQVELRLGRTMRYTTYCRQTCTCEFSATHSAFPNTFISSHSSSYRENRKETLAHCAKDVNI